MKWVMPGLKKKEIKTQENEMNLSKRQCQLFNVFSLHFWTECEKTLSGAVGTAESYQEIGNSAPGIFP